MASIWDFLRRKKDDGSNDLEAVLTPEKQPNFLQQFLPEDPDKREAVARALIQGGAAAMMAGGPSVGKPTNLLQVLGAGVASAGQGYGDALDSNLEAKKFGAANRLNDYKMKTLGDNQARTKAFVAKWGSPGVNGYPPEALGELAELQMLNGDDEGARQTLKQVQALQQKGAEEGMVIDQATGGFKLAPGFGQSMFDVEKAKGLGGAVGKNAETTADIKNYEYGVEKPGFVDYQTAQKRAGVQQPEDKFAGKSAELAATDMADIVKQGTTAQELAGNVQILADLSKQIGTGRWAEAKKAWGPTFEAFGIKVDNLSEIQAMDSLAARVSPQLRVAGTGATSDFDAQQFVKSIPSLGNTPDGNQMIATTMNAVTKNKVEAARIASEVQRGNIDYQEGYRQIAALPDPFQQFKEYQKAAKVGGSDKSPSSDTSAKGDRLGGVVTVTSEEQFNALPKGTTYRIEGETGVWVK
ncbi:hypothetical protein [Neorhizobium sp. NCHU2750]|uniref:hypothetical protein n=1 Tax=Neorhizobium sp. NCHU2750 TaxID=1825976 RepID=UPI000E75D6BF|nr:hypothetical protein NCHU2750_23580 [Neorhizobium sp. NCHU2750]